MTLAESPAFWSGSRSTSFGAGLAPGVEMVSYCKRRNVDTGFSRDKVYPPILRLTPSTFDPRPERSREKKFIIQFNDSHQRLWTLDRVSY